MKITTSIDNIKSFGGLNFISAEFDKLQLPELITHHLGKHIVYFENRNGNSNVKFKQAETLQSAYDLLKSKNISIDRSRMDCGSFTKDIIKVVEANSKRFYIRAQRCEELSNQIREVKQWETVRIGLFDVEVCSIEYYNQRGGVKILT